MPRRARYDSALDGTSGGLPISSTPTLRLGELVATFALAQDNAFGQPLESQLRSCLLAMSMCDAAGYGDQLRSTIYWTSLLRYIGCTGHAHEVAVVFGDEIGLRALTLTHDGGNIAEVMHDVMTYATAGRSPEEAAPIIEALQAGAHDWAVHNFASGCEVGDMLTTRLDVGDGVRQALACTFERWNGQGFPNSVAGTDIPLAMRVVHLSHDMEAIGRLHSPERAVAAAEQRAGRTYDPELAELFVAHGLTWFGELAKLDPWDAVLDREPEPHRLLSGHELDEALLVAADFIDLKSPYMAGHSRRCAQLCAAAAELLRLGAEEVDALRRAALVHDFGTTAIPNSIWDKPGPLTRAETDRVQLHTVLTEQMLRRSAALDVLNPIAAAHHERADGSGYPRGTRAAALDPYAGVLAAADIYVGLTTERADRPAASVGHAAAELRRLAVEGVLDRPSADAVLAAAGHDPTRPQPPSRGGHPGGLTRREVEVLRLATRGLTTREIADRLFISAKTCDHHIQHVYTKIGVSTRAAAALWAMEHDLVG